MSFDRCPLSVREAAALAAAHAHPAPDAAVLALKRLRFVRFLIVRQQRFSDDGPPKVKP